ncbi:MAG TPA: hypothetical protein VGJ05_17535 [Fimbriiglobus sp.]|jgi:hypothetical protein
MLRRFLAGIALSLATPVAQAVDPNDLLKYLPSPVNTVCVVNVGQILSSPRAVKGKWDRIDQTEYLAGAVPVHPNVERIVVGTEYSPAQQGRSGSVAVLSTKKPVDLAKLAAGFGTELTTAGGEPAVLTRSGTAFLKLDDKLLGAVTTEHRPDVGRFGAYAKTAKQSLQSQYLNAAIYNDGLKSHILIVVDVADMIGPKDAERAVALTDLAKQDKGSANAVQAFVAGLKGVRFAATVTDSGINVVIRMDSAVDLQVSPEWMKAFVIDILNRNGAGLEDLPAAVAKAGEKNVTLSFRMTDPELAFVMALVLPPAAARAGQAAIPVAPPNVTVEATRKYFKTVNQVVDDLKKKNKKAKAYQETALWHDAAATKIDTTSVLGVDPIAVTYGRGTAANLRSIADSLRGVPVQAAELESKAYYYVQQGPSVRFAPFRGLYFDMWARPVSESTNLPEIRSKQAEVIRQDEENRTKIWNKIDNERPAVKTRLSEKFKGKF